MSIEQKIQEFLKSPAGQAKIDVAIVGDLTNEVLNLQNSIIQEQGELPFSFGVSNGAITFESNGEITTAKCEIEFSHQDATRHAFWSGGKWPNGDLIYLFNNGFSFSSDNPPHGAWGGRKWVAAMTSRQATHFVQNAVNRYLASAPDGVSVEIDGSYT